MLRKGLIIISVTFVRDPLLRIYCAIWILLLFLTLQWVARPFETELANTLETASLSIIAVTLNMALLWFYPQFQTGPRRHHRSGLGGLCPCRPAPVPCPRRALCFDPASDGIFLNNDRGQAWAVLWEYFFSLRVACGGWWQDSAAGRRLARNRWRLMVNDAGWRWPTAVTRRLLLCGGPGVPEAGSHFCLRGGGGGYRQPWGRCRVHANGRGGRPGQRVEEQGTWAAQKHSEAGYGRPVDRGVWTAKTVKRPRQQPAHPQYANYWAPLTRKRHAMPHSAQSQHTKLLGSANAETTPARAPAAAADRTQRPDATCEGKNG